MTCWRDEPVMTRRRRIALAEARALRAYLRATSRLPRCTPTNWEWT